MRFSTLLPFVAVLGLLTPATASARTTTGFVRIAAPPAGETSEAPGASEASPSAAPNAEEEAMTLFKAGQIAYRNQDFRRALEFFQDAQSRHPSSIFHFNIGLCYEALEKPEQAVDAYRAYLRSGPADRGDIEGRIKALEATLASGGDKTPTPAPAPPAETEPTPAPAPEAAAAPAAPADPVEPIDANPGRSLIITGATLSVVGAALAGGLGGWQGSIAGDRADRVFDVFESGNPQGLTLAETQALDEEGKRANGIALGSIAAGAAVGLTGVALVVVGVLKNKKAKQSASVQVTPTADRNSAGLSLSGRF